MQQFAEQYAALEREVQELTSALCAESCALCSSCCCRADLCEEALNSPFLSMLHRRDFLDSDAYGFLSETGCVLDAGRPPVCYEFFCDELLNNFDERQCDMLRKLGALPMHAGLIDDDLHIADLNSFARIDFSKLNQQLDDAFATLEEIKNFFGVVTA